MRGWLKRLGWGACSLLILLAVAWGTSRLLGPADAQEAALATMRQPIPALQGRNAFALFWQLPYAIPEAERESVFARDLRRMGRNAHGGPVDASARPAAEAGAAAVSAAEGRYPPSLAAETLTRFCSFAEDCLEKVSADVPAYAALVDENAALLDRVESLQDHAGLRQSFGYRYDAPIPAYQYGRLPLTRQAVLFLRGERDAALDAACRSVSAWRRVGSDSDSLVSRLIGTAAVDAHGRLFAQMLAGTPRDAALPASCTAAFAAPAGHELSLCSAIRGEFALTDTAIADAPDDAALYGVGWSKRLSWLLFDPTMTAAQVAEPYAFHCSAEAARAMAGDVRIEVPRSKRGLLLLQCVSNATGCILGDIASPGFDDYVARVQDSNAQLRLIGVLLRLRVKVADARPFEQRLRDAAAAVGAPARAPTPIADGAAVRIRNYATARGEYREIPLPAYFRSAGAASR